MNNPIVKLTHIRKDGKHIGNYLEIAFGKTHILFNLDNDEYLAAIGYKDNNLIGFTTGNPQKREVRTYLNEWMDHYSIRVPGILRGVKEEEFKKLFFVKDERINHV